MSSRQLILATLVMLATTPVTAAQKLECPPGTQAKRESLPEGKASEWCEDAKTRKQNGPARILGAADVVLVDAEYRQGEVVRQRFTPAGLEKLFAEVNAGYAKEGKPAFFTVLDEHNLRFDMTLEGKVPGGDLEEFRKGLVKLAPVCRMFAAPGTDFRSIDIRAANEKKESLGALTITPADCPKPAAR